MGLNPIGATAGRCSLVEYLTFKNINQYEINYINIFARR